MNEIKYYKLFAAFYKVEGSKVEQVSAYKHRTGIIQSIVSQFDLSEMEPITEAQYLRVRKIIMLKLNGHV
jgi:hypothetical protein